jgi:hypothetical protein
MADGGIRARCETCEAALTAAELRACVARRARYLEEPGTDRWVVWPVRCGPCYAAAQRVASGPEGAQGVDGADNARLDLRAGG